MKLGIAYRGKISFKVGRAQIWLKQHCPASPAGFKALLWNKDFISTLHLWLLTS